MVSRLVFVFCAGIKLFAQQAPASSPSGCHVENVRQKTGLVSYLKTFGRLLDKFSWMTIYFGVEQHGGPCWTKSLRQLTLAVRCYRRQFKRVFNRLKLFLEEFDVYSDIHLDQRE